MSVGVPQHVFDMPPAWSAPSQNQQTWAMLQGVDLHAVPAGGTDWDAYAGAWVASGSVWPNPVAEGGALGAPEEPKGSGGGSIDTECCRSDTSTGTVEGRTDTWSHTLTGSTEDRHSYVYAPVTVSCVAPGWVTAHPPLRVVA